MVGPVGFSFLYNYISLKCTMLISKNKIDRLFFDAPRPTLLVFKHVSEIFQSTHRHSVIFVILHKGQRNHRLIGIGYTIYYLSMAMFGDGIVYQGVKPRALQE